MSSDSMEEVGVTSRIVKESVDQPADINLVPVQSGKSSLLISNSILAIILLAVSIKILHKECCIKAIYDTVSIVCFFVGAFGIVEIILRIYNFLAELIQISSKYEGNIDKVFKATLSLNNASLIVILTSLVIFLILQVTFENTVKYVWHFGPIACIPAFVVAAILCQMIGLRNSPINTALTAGSIRGLDYGTGMAFSYFYGYLVLILPSDGHYNPGLRAKMEQYEAEQNVSIPVKKLFILIPSSGHIPPDLKESSEYWLESTTSLESEFRDRAGVKRRVYKSTVYKIHPGGEGKDHRPVYVTTEGATPMLTLWEILQHSHPQTADYREHRQQIIASFYETLQMLLKNDPRCRDTCELVYYNDYDANGKKVNVGELLLNRIRAQAASSF